MTFKDMVKKLGKNKLSTAGMIAMKKEKLDAWKYLEMELGQPLTFGEAWPLVNISIEYREMELFKQAANA